MMNNCYYCKLSRKGVKADPAVHCMPRVKKGRANSGPKGVNK